MTAYLKWEEPREFTLKKHKEKVHSAKKLDIYKIISGLFFASFFMLVWFLAKIQEHNDILAFWLALIIAIVLALFMMFVVPFLESKCNPPKVRIKVTNKGIHRIDLSLNRLWKFSDIADFKITREPIGDSFINILELKDFNISSIAIGIPSEISVETLKTLLSEKIGIAREQIKLSNINPSQEWGAMAGVLLILLSFMILILTIFLFDFRDQDKKLSFMRDDLQEVKSQFNSGNPAPLQEKAFEKVASKSYSAKYSISKLINLQIRIILGSISIAAILFGCILILWARSRRLFNRIRKLEIMCAELLIAQKN